MSDKKQEFVSIKTKIYRWVLGLDRKIELWVEHMIQQLE